MRANLVVSSARRLRDYCCNSDNTQEINAINDRLQPTLHLPPPVTEGSSTTNDNNNSTDDNTKTVNI